MPYDIDAMKYQLAVLCYPEEMARWNTGAKNGMWKGGTVVASNGYVLVRVGIAHPSSDVRGYAYEHRLVAEQMLGRPLRSNEIVHHKNGIKKDNRPANLQIVDSIAEHRELHRQWVGRLKKANAPNPIVECKCGCGKRFRKYDKYNRPREYVSGHNPINSPTMDAILTILQNGPLSRTEIAECSDKTIRQIATALSKMKKNGLIMQSGHGIWCLPKDYSPSLKNKNLLLRCACGCETQLRQFDKYGRERKYISGHNMKRPEK